MVKKILFFIVCSYYILPVTGKGLPEESEDIHEAFGYGIIGLSAARALAADFGIGYRVQEGAWVFILF